MSVTHAPAAHVHGRNNAQAEVHRRAARCNQVGHTVKILERLRHLTACERSAARIHPSLRPHRARAGRRAPATNRCPVCTKCVHQGLLRLCASHCAISLLWCGNFRSTPAAPPRVRALGAGTPGGGRPRAPPLWRSKRGPKHACVIAEHSTCHPYGGRTRIGGAMERSAPASPQANANHKNQNQNNEIKSNDVHGGHNPHESACGQTDR